MRRSLATAHRKEKLSALPLAIATCLTASAAHAAGPSAADPFKIYVSDRYSYEDNLFHVSDGRRAEGAAARGVQSFDDYINRLSVGIQTRIDTSRQVFALNLRADDVRYTENDYLNQRGGNGDLKWTFNIGSHLSGLLDARYDRGQASNSNYTVFIKDVVDTQSYLGELRFKIGSRWALLGAGALTDSEHSAAVRQQSNMESKTGRVGIEYGTPASTLVAIEYSVMKATYPEAEDFFGAEVSFEQTLPMIRASYVFSEKTRINARAGYIDRDFTTGPVTTNYSGATWDVSAYWEPRVQIYFDAQVWRDLRAYTDSESNYFVSNGVSLKPTWAPTPVMNFAFSLQYEKQDYRNSAALLLVDDPDSIVEPNREDTVKSAGVTWEYTPRDFFNIALSYRWIDRDSNREIRAYGAEVASAQIKFQF